MLESQWPVQEVDLTNNHGTRDLKEKNKIIVGYSFLNMAIC